MERAFKMRAAGAGWGESAAFLNRHSKPATGKQWIPRTVQHMIGNRVYLGIAYSGEFENKNAHPAIVTRELWQAAQRKTVTRKPLTGNLEDHPLTGVVRCAGCRHRMKPDRYGPANNRVAIYRCRGNHGSGKCPAPATITAKRLNDFILERFFAKIEGITATASESSENYDLAAAELAKAEDSLRAYLADDEVKNLVSRDSYLSGVQGRQAAVDAASATLDAIERKASGIELPDEIGKWSDFTIPEKRKMLGAGLDAVFIKRTENHPNVPVEERASIFWRGEAPDDLPSSGVVVPIRSLD